MSVEEKMTDKAMEIAEAIIGTEQRVVQIRKDGELHYFAASDLVKFIRPLLPKPVEVNCSRCGRGVSSPVYADDDLIIRAFVECPECVEKQEVGVVAESDEALMNNLAFCELSYKKGEISSEQCVQRKNEIVAAFREKRERELKQQAGLLRSDVEYSKSVRTKLQGINSRLREALDPLIETARHLLAFKRGWHRNESTEQDQDCIDKAQAALEKVGKDEITRL